MCSFGRNDGLEVRPPGAFHVIPVERGGLLAAPFGHCMVLASEGGEVLEPAWL